MQVSKQVGKFTECTMSARRQPNLMQICYQKLL